MAYDTTLTARIRELAAGHPAMVEKKMFGGISFILQGNMACGVHGVDLIVRLAPGDMEAALAKPGVRVFDLTGRPMKGWLVVAGDACSDDAVLQDWVERSVTFAQSLPPK
jgi:TfoX/Sxy family transcriptional regulator of competence genes